MIHYDTPHFIYKVGSTSLEEILELGPEFWKSKLYQHNTVIIDDINIDKDGFNKLSNLFGQPWPKELYQLHGESLSDPDQLVVDWNHNTGLKTLSLPWHQDNPWHPEYRFPIRIIYSLEIEDSTSGVLTFSDTAEYYKSLDHSTKQLYNSWELLVHDYRNPDRKFWYPFVQTNPVTGEHHLLINALDVDIDFFGLQKSAAYQKGKTHIISARNKFTNEEFDLNIIGEEYKKCINFSDNIYHHYWTANQIVVFSNLNVVHTRTALRENVKRIMYRKTLFHDYQYAEYLENADAVHDSDSDH